MNSPTQAARYTSSPRHGGTYVFGAENGRMDLYANLTRDAYAIKVSPGRRYRDTAAADATTPTPRRLCTRASPSKSTAVFRITSSSPPTTVIRSTRTMPR